MGTVEAERPILLTGTCSPQDYDGICGTKQESLPRDAASGVGAESEAGAARGAGNKVVIRGAKPGHSTCLAYGPSQCAGVLVKASCAVMCVKTIAMHKM